MKNILILIFLFLAVLLFFIFPVSADTGQFTWSGTSTDTYNAGATGSHTGTRYITGFHVIDASTLYSLDYMSWTVSDVYYEGPEPTAAYQAVSFYIGGDNVGSGYFGHIRNEAEGTVRVYLVMWSDFSLSDYSGAQDITFTNSLDIRVRNIASSGTCDRDYALLQSQSDQAYFITTTGWGVCTDYGSHTYYTQASYSFSNFYEYYPTKGTLYFYLNRTNDKKLKVTINNSYINITNEDAYENDDLILYDNDIINNTWSITAENEFSTVDTHVINFGVLSVGEIGFNKSSYTEPEVIQIDAELTNYDFANHIYRILMEYSTDDGANWERLSVAFNSTSIMSNVTECRTATIDSSYYTLPIKIRAVIDDYNKLTSSSSTIATSDEVYYNPPAAYDYIISGTVFDADTGAIIEGALVSASGVTTTSSTSTVTGKFQLYLSEGIYTITTSKSGYQNNVQSDLLIDHDVTWAQIHLVPIGTGNGTLYGNVNDANTGYAILDVHVIITNATDRIDAYTSSGGYYEATGLAQSSTYTVRALKTGYYTYNGSVTTEASGATHKSFEMVQVNYSATPTPTEVSTYPGGEGHEWSNDEIVTMLRVLVPGFFMMMLIFLFLAVILGVTGNNGGNGGQRGLGLDDIWRRK